MADNKRRFEMSGRAEDWVLKMIKEGKKSVESHPGTFSTGNLRA